ncbi:MAG: hypothetical protein ABI577_16485, partial [bacterium]
MELSRSRYLVSAAGKDALASIPAETATKDPVRLSTELRKLFPPEEASALAEQLTLRARAIRNHGLDRRWLFTAHGLEMMTHPLVAAHRSARFASWGLP